MTNSRKTRIKALFFTQSLPVPYPLFATTTTQYALRFTPVDGTVNVVSGLNHQLVETLVSDQGPGINEDFLDRIFDPFFRADKSRYVSLNQHGIGLALTRTIIELHGGTISARNGVHGGLIVNIQLPAETDKNISA